MKIFNRMAFPLAVILIFIPIIVNKYTKIPKPIYISLLVIGLALIIYSLIVKDKR